MNAQGTIGAGSKRSADSTLEHTGTTDQLPTSAPPLESDLQLPALLSQLDDKQRLLLSAMFPLAGSGLSHRAAASAYGVTAASAAALKQSAVGVAYATDVQSRREKLELERQSRRLKLAEKAEQKLELVLDAAEGRLALDASTEVLDRVPAAGLTKVSRAESTVTHEHRLLDPEMLRARTQAAVVKMRELTAADVAGGASILEVTATEIREECPALVDRVYAPKATRQAANKGRRERERQAEREAEKDWKPTWSKGVQTAVQAAAGMF